MSHTIEWNAGAIFGASTAIAFGLAQVYFVTAYFYGLNLIYGG